MILGDASFFIALADGTRSPFAATPPPPANTSFVTGVGLDDEGLPEIERRKRDEHISSISGPQQDVNFGSQIRSYVLEGMYLADERAGFVPAPGEICRNADPNRPGVCHTLLESDYENNIAQVTVTVPDHRGRQSVGPLKDEPPVTGDLMDGIN